MNFRGIQFRLLLLSIIPTILIVATSALFFVQHHYLDLEDSLKEKGRITVQQLAISSIYGVFSGNSQILNDIALALLNDPDISSVQIFDRSGQELANIKRMSILKETELLFFQHPVTIQKIKQQIDLSTQETDDDLVPPPAKIIGSVKIALSQSNTQTKQQTYLFGSLLLISIGGFCTLLITIRLSKTISKPIINLTKTANSLDNKDMNARAKGSRISEIDDLCQSFNSMAIGLQETQTYLLEQVEIAVKELKISLDKLEKKNLALKKSTQQAISQNKTKSQFLAHISHEIRTPMNGILGFIELLTKSNLTKHQLERAQLIKISATSLITIVNEILDYSSLETGNFNISISSFKFREMIENCATLITPASKDVQIIIDIDSNIPELISTDALRLQQIITNLLGNACKFTHQGYIVIRCHLIAPSSLFVSVSDSGTGIHNDVSKELFQPFLHNRKYLANNELGTGLGLTISKNIIERLGGKIGVCSQLNIGTTFWINLPISVPSQDSYTLKKGLLFVIDPIILRRKAFIKQLNYLGYPTLEFNTIDEMNYQKELNCELLFYSDKSDNHRLVQTPEHLSSITNCPVIFLQSRHHSTPSINCLTLPCRSSFLQKSITTITKNDTITKRPNQNIEKQLDSFSIFIADDNEINRLLLKAQLEPHCKNIAIANEGKTALNYLQNNKYDLILLDLQMPYFSGLDLIKIIKLESSINKDSPVIAITAHAQSHQRKTLIDSGFDECLIKPILLEHINELLNLWLPKTELNHNKKSVDTDYIAIMLNKTSGNIELAKTLFNKLFIELQEQSLLLEKNISSSEFQLAEEIIHKLHGSVSFCGFTDIQTHARNLEISLIDNNLSLINSSFYALKDTIISFCHLQNEILKELNDLVE